MKAKLSTDALRKSYFGQETKDTPSVSSLVRAPNELSNTSRFFVHEARELLSARPIDSEEVLEEDSLVELIEGLEDKHGEELSEPEKKSVMKALSNMRLDYDVLTPLVENTEVNDIIVRNWRDISAQMAGRKNIATDIRFPDESAYKAFIENLLKRVGKACTTAQPVVDAAIEPDVRACVTHESFSPTGTGPLLTLRISRHKGVTVEQLLHSELAPKAVLDYLITVIAKGAVTALIGGEVGTGKTTLVRALASEMPSDEALLVIEDTNEISLERPFVRNLLTREANTEGAGRITPADAIRAGMRMAMNRVILGEMRDGNAAEAFIDVCSSGHAGLSTIHARSARDALSRLELLLSRVRSNVGTDYLRREIANAVGVVVYLDIDSNGTRRISEVLEITSAADGPLQLQPIFSFSAEDKTWIRGAGISRWQNKLKECAVVLPDVNTHITFSEDTLYEHYQHDH